MHGNRQSKSPLADGGIVQPVDGRSLAAGLTEWFDREVPAIVAGLESTGDITPWTASEARRLIAEGHADEALRLSLGEADR